MWGAWLLHGRVVQIYIGNFLNNFFSDGSYIAEPARCQSRKRLLKIGFWALFFTGVLRSGKTIGFNNFLLVILHLCCMLPVY